MIYIVEDDENMGEIESYTLQNSGYESIVCANSKELYEAIEVEEPELIILDSMLVDEDGVDILKDIRKKSKYDSIPIIFVTAKSMEIDKVKALDAGADDYITKPFGIMEFVSRVKAVLRRFNVNKKNKDKVLYCGDVVIDDMSRDVMVKGKNCILTYKEFELLKLLVKNVGIVLSRECIMEKVWGFDFQGESRTVDMHIKTLRQKLGKEGNIIKTIRNVGYKAE